MLNCLFEEAEGQHDLINTEQVANLYLRLVLSMPLQQFFPIPILHSRQGQRRFLCLHQHTCQLISLSLFVSNPPKSHRARFRLLVQYRKERPLQVYTFRCLLEPFCYIRDTLADEWGLEGFVDRRFRALLTASLGFLLRRG